MNEDHDKHDREELAAVLAALPDRVSHLPTRLVLNDLAVLMDAWADVRRAFVTDPGRPNYIGLKESDIVLIDEMVGRVEILRRKCVWYSDR